VFAIVVAVAEGVCVAVAQLEMNSAVLLTIKKYFL
jgi:hypothetical protein